MQEMFRAIPGLLEQLEANETAREALACALWRRVAGDLLAEHTVPIALTRSRLVVAVSGIAWRRQLEDLSGQMVFKLNAALGSRAVEFIEFIVDAEAVDKAGLNSVRRTTAAAELKERGKLEISTDLARAADAIEDDNLRSMFLEAAASCLARRNDRLAKNAG